jgi:protein gp37
MHPDWARSLRDQCTSAGVPFFFKQWGEFLPGAGPDPRKEIPIHCSTDGLMHRVGKKAAGALLDGVEWKQFPEASA